MYNKPMYNLLVAGFVPDSHWLVLIHSPWCDDQRLIHEV